MKNLTLIKKLKILNASLMNDRPDKLDIINYRGGNLQAQRALLRFLMNTCPPMEFNEEFLKLQDEILSAEVLERGIVKFEDIPNINKNIKLWQGDITRLEIDAIVNAANSALLGCFVPFHKCIDNAIHSAAGLQLRNACYEIMQKQGHDEPTGQAKITPAFNLPSKFIIHTVGPIIPPDRFPNSDEENLLASCYKSCLELAMENNLTSIAFCCISTGEFHFPNQRAAEIAIKTVTDFIDNNTYNITVIFNTFKDIDTKIYESILKV